MLLRVRNVVSKKKKKNIILTTTVVFIITHGIEQRRAERQIFSKVLLALFRMRKAIDSRKQLDALHERTNIITRNAIAKDI